MIKKIQKMGNSQGIIFSKSECEAYGFNIGDFIVFEPKKKNKVK